MLREVNYIKILYYYLFFYLFVDNYYIRLIINNEYKYNLLQEMSWILKVKIPFKICINHNKFSQSKYNHL